MRFQKAIILFFLITSFAVSQNSRVTLVFMNINSTPCAECEVTVNGKPNGATDYRGRYLLYYDTTRTEKFVVEIVNSTPKMSKRFTITLGKDIKNPESQLVMLNKLGAYLNIDEAKGNFSETLNQFKDAGVTDVFVPVFANGKTLFPSKVEGVISSDRDYLNEIITECNNLKLCLYATINTLNWGIGNTANPKSNDYLMVNKKGEYNKGEEGKYLFVSPAHPEVIRILAGITKEIASNYKYLDGINFDYLRFKEGSYKKLDQEDFGFEKNAVELFKSNYRLDPYQVKFDTTKGSDWLKWIEFKENLLTNLFVKLVSAAKDTNSNLKIILNLNPSYLSERGFNLTCANAYDFEQFIYPDHYFLEFSKKDIANEMRMIDQYLPGTNPFEEKGVVARRAIAFIPLIKNESALSHEEFDKIIQLLIKKEKAGNFSIFNQSIFGNLKNRELLKKIITD